MQRSFVVLVVVCIGLSACGGGSGQVSETAFRVALVTPGPVSDAGWNAAAYAALGRLQDELGAETYHLEASSPAEFEEAFRDFAKRGCSVVFGHGFEFQDAARVVGADFPDTAFVVTSGRYVSDNVGGLVFRLEEAAYLAGVMAGGVSESGVAGMIGGMEIPPVKLVFEGFRRGFLNNRPGGVVKEIYLGNWEDAAAARQATVSLARQGADVVIHNADAAGQGVFQACREHGLVAFGTNSDQAWVAPDVVLASAVMDIPEAMVVVARQVQAGAFTGTVFTFDLESGVVSLVLNPALKDGLDGAVIEAVDRERARILAGDVELEHF